MGFETTCSKINFDRFSITLIYNTLLLWKFPKCETFILVIWIFNYNFALLQIAKSAFAMKLSFHPESFIPDSFNIQMKEFGRGNRN